MIAREEIASLRKNVTDLQQELSTTKGEAAAFLEKVLHEIL